MTNRRGQAQDLIAQADQLMAADDQGRPSPSGQLDRLPSHGLPLRLDREIRRVKTTSQRWAELTADQASAASAGSDADRIGLTLVLACHANGFVREAMVDLVTDSERSIGGDLLHYPGVTRMLAHRALDPVPSIRHTPRRVLTTLFEAELRRQPRGWMFTSIEVAAREVAGRAASIDRCPELLDLALDLFDSSIPVFHSRHGPTHHLPGAAERHRHRQIISHLQRGPGGENTGRAQRVQRLITWHRQALVETG